jgi:hypothetical protein
MTKTIEIADPITSSLPLPLAKAPMVTQDMQMSVGGARYYIRLASERKAKQN